VKRLAAALELARTSRSRTAKEEALGAAFAAIGRDSGGAALSAAARLAAGRTLAVGDGRPLGAGFSLLMETAAASSGFSAGIIAACARATGDLGEAVALLAARAPGADERPGLSLDAVAGLFESLASTGNRLAKRRALDQAFALATPLETKYLAKALLGSLRVGAQAGVVEGAIARAFGAPMDKVRRALALVADVGEVAVLALRGQLDSARFRPGRPVAFMLASPMETIATPLAPSRYVMEAKIDGVRAQVHKIGGVVAIFARGLDRMTAAFPELVEAFQPGMGGVALDGEIVAVGANGRPRPFQALQGRLRRIAPTQEQIQDTPVAFFAYDILSDGDDELLALPWTERRARLEAFVRERGPRSAFVLNPYADLPEPPPSSASSTPTELLASVDSAFSAARAGGFEGLVLKRTDAPYEAGRRGQAWIKVKRAYATLDVVVTAAEEGHGRRAGVLSDYTFGVRKGDAIVNVGKAYSGLTDVEIEGLSARLEGLTVGRSGPLRLIRPAVVLEVAFDGVQRSTRHDSGFALRFPRIVRIREDKAPADVDAVEVVSGLFRGQVDAGHREQAPAARTAPARRPKVRATDRKQLNLFGDLEGTKPK